MYKYDFYVDLHCHPAMKAFGKSFNNSTREHSNNPGEENSIWHQKTPNFFRKTLNALTSLTKFTQSDTTTLLKGGVHVVCASLYPLEKGFVRTHLGRGVFTDVSMNLVTGIGKKRIDHLQNLDSYYTDLEEEYQFYKDLDGVVVELEGEHKVRYKIVRNYDDIVYFLNENENSDITTICILITIEGLHVLDCGLDGRNSNADINTLIANLDKIKNWEHRPFFITFAHHFWNELCGHAKTLIRIPDLVTNQECGLDLGFTDKGKVILRQLLDDTNQNRILIDIKHMSVQARKEYYEILDTEYPNDNIPIIISHGAVNGLASLLTPDKQSPLIKKKNLFYKEDINFYDDEIIRLARSGGIIGLQMDERRLVCDTDIIKRSFKKHKKLHYRSEILWRQMKHIAELLDGQGLPAWDNMSIGSDFDGMVDPINGFWTAREMDLLASYLERHVYSYLKDGCTLRVENKIAASDVISKLMSTNAMEFFKKHFNTSFPSGPTGGGTGGIT